MLYSIDAFKINKVALYCRVSTDEQANEGFSLESQLERLRSFCIAREWNVIAEYVDGGYSGRNIRRPEYKKMLDEIEKWDAIVVIKMDRIHRNRLNFIEMMNDLQNYNKQFISMTESLDTSTAMGRFVMGIIQDIAQLESEQIGERVFAGQLQKAKKEESGFMGHRVPFGYRWNSNNKSFVEVPEELEIIKRIFQMYIDRFSMRQISKILKNENKDKIHLIPEKKLSNTSIRYYLHNCFYAGVERWCHFFKKSDIKPVISVEMFNNVQRKLRNNCHSHRNYDPMLLKNMPSFKLGDEERQSIPIINRAKHNFAYQG